MKYDEHGIYIQNIFNAKTKPIYLIRKSTGTILVSLTKKLSLIPRKTLRSYVTYRGSSRFMLESLRGDLNWRSNMLIYFGTFQKIFFKLD